MDNGWFMRRNKNTMKCFFWKCVLLFDSFTVVSVCADRIIFDSYLLLR